MPYIESKYTVEGKWSDAVLNEFMIGMQLSGTTAAWSPALQVVGFHPIVIPVSELTQEDLFLLWRTPGSSIRFTAVPEIKSQTFTITMRDRRTELHSPAQYRSPSRSSRQPVPSTRHIRPPSALSRQSDLEGRPSFMSCRKILTSGGT